MVANPASLVNAQRRIARRLTWLERPDVDAAFLARTKGGKTPKLTIKSLSNISTSGRVYCIRVSGKHKGGSG